MARRGGDGEDADEPRYDCSSCDGETRVARRCDVQPTEELQEYRDHVRATRGKDEITGTTPAERYAQAAAILKPGCSRDLGVLVRRVYEVEEARVSAERMDIDAGLGPFGLESRNELLCPLIRTTPESDRWCVAYRRAQALTTGMGGAISWGGRGAAHEDCRRLDAFSIIQAAQHEGNRG